MISHLLHSRKYFTTIFSLLFFAVSFLTFPVQTTAQTRSSQRERRVQIFFAYNPTRPAAGQEVQFQDFSRGNPTSWLWDFGDGQTSILQNPRYAYATPGSYRVIMTARNNVSSGRMSRTLNVILSTSASFTYGPAYPVTGQAVQFTDTSTGGPTSWLWDFGDNTTSTSQNPSHAYTTAQSYTVTLTVVFSSGSKTASQTITVVPALAAAFTFTPTSPVAGQPVQFMDASTGSPTSWQWSSSDGATSNLQNPIHIFTTAGSYTVTLTVAYSSGSKSISQTITVLPPPALSASFSYSPSSPVAGQAVQFTDTSTGNPTSWLWNFGDSTTSTSKNPSHTYATAASYTVTLTVTNSAASKSVSQTISVLPASTFIASFTYSPSSPAAGQVVYFTDTSTGNPTSWQWNFGDGATSTTRNPSHTYATAATHTVTLTVTNSSGSKSTSQTVTVLPAFSASFTYSPSSPAIGQAVQYTDTSTGSPTSWQWNFGDNATSTIQNPSHTYSAAGQNWVNLIITKGSDSQSTSQMITVREPGIIRAASPALSDVRAAINAAIPGDTVIVPAGTATWTDQLTINKGIILNGAGANNTIITGNMSSDKYMVWYEPSSPQLNNPFRLTGFSFDSGGTCHGLMIRNWTLYPINKVRIDHNIFKNGCSGRFIYFTGHAYGVMDNNEVTFLAWGSLCFGNCGMDPPSWQNFGFEFGSVDNIYVENNIIKVIDTVMQSEQGGRYCFRYNTIYYVNNRIFWSLFDVHGNQEGGQMATFGAEIYENQVISDYYGGLFAGLRGGKGLVYNNTFSVSGAEVVQDNVKEEYYDSISPPANSPINGQPQHISDTYFWNNVYTNGSGAHHVEPYNFFVNATLNYGGSEGIVPTTDKHYWLEKPGFDGSSGIGFGLISARPATCTKGVGYWATDTKTLYRATATNVWTAYYTPYTYPHPLRNILSD